jgi:hypothetical protein
MSELDEVYGSFPSGKADDNVFQISKVLTNGIIGHDFQMHYDFTDIWDKDVLKDKVIKYISDQVGKYEHLKLDIINKKSSQMNMFRYFINEPKICYFRLIDYREGRIYLLYLTDKIMDAY